MTVYEHGELIWVNRILSNGQLECPGCSQGLSRTSHQADPCIHCHYALHDRCFYTREHGCVRADLIEARSDYSGNC